MNDPNHQHERIRVKHPAPHVSRSTTRWMRLVLGFSISVAIGLAPFLGRVHVPLFTPMLSLIPQSLQDIAIPVSAVSMGIVAIVVQWTGSQGTTARLLRRRFRQALILCIISLVVLVILEMLAVVRIEVPAVKNSVSYVVGFSSAAGPRCQSLSRADCIKHQLLLDEAAIDSYFGENQVNIAKLLLVVIYAVFMSSFGALVGVVALAHSTRD